MPLGSSQSWGCSSAGSRRRSTWSVVHETVATVGMPEALVDQRAPRVVDAGDDPLDPEVLAGDAGGEDVRVVAAGDRGDGAGALDAGLDQVVAVEAEADDLLAAEVLGQALAERVGVLVDDGDRVASFSRLRASSLPTRPHPTTTTCTAVSLRRSGPGQAIAAASAERAIG